MQKNTIALFPLVVAIAALVLSQFRPLHTYIDKPNLVATIPQRIQVFHHFGNLQLYVYVQVRNSGHASGTITRMELFVRKRNEPNYSLRLPLVTYLPTPTSGSVVGQVPVQVPVGTITVAPGETWEAFGNFLFVPDKEEQLKISSLSVAIRDQIEKKVSQFPPGIMAPMVFIDNRLYSTVSTLVGDNLGEFKEGDYDMLLRIWDDQSVGPIITQAFTFFVYEQDIRSLAAITRLYRTGEGVFLPPTRLMGFYTDLTRITDESRLNNLKNHVPD